MFKVVSERIERHIGVYFNGNAYHVVVVTFNVFSVALFSYIELEFFFCLVGYFLDIFCIAYFDGTVQRCSQI